MHPFKKLLPWLLIAAAALALFLILLFLPVSGNTNNAPATNYVQLETRINKGYVKSLLYNPGSQVFTVTERGRPPYTVAVPATTGPEGLQSVLSVARAKGVPVPSTPLNTGASTISIILNVLPALLIVILLAFIWLHLMPGGRRRLKPAHSRTTYADVAGCDEIIEELGDVRSFLADPQRYERLGAKAPKGVLLHGPAGTGKTLLARAIAHEAGIPFFETSGASFVEMFAGLGASRVRATFKVAKRVAPSIIFIDELDAVGGRRTAQGKDSATRESDQTLNQLLTEMDGFNISENPVIVIGATNLLEALDPALLRPGRFDRSVTVDPPNRQGRRDILEVHARDKPLAKNVSLDEMATRSSGMTGAELARWLNEAALTAGRCHHEVIEHEDIEEAYDRHLAGLKREHGGLSEEERKIVAYHESGHALLGELLRSTERVHKVSIVPRSRSGGHTISVSEEDAYLHTKKKLREVLTIFLGGRAAEELIFKQTTSGSADDLKHASDLALRMVRELGMSKALGLRVVSDEEVSSEQEARIDQEVRELLDEEYKHAKELLTKHRAALERVAEALLEEETIERKRLLELMA